MHTEMTRSVKTTGYFPVLGYDTEGKGQAPVVLLAGAKDFLCWQTSGWPHPRITNIFHDNHVVLSGSGIGGDVYDLPGVDPVRCLLVDTQTLAVKLLGSEAPGLKNVARDLFGVQYPKINPRKFYGQVWTARSIYFEQDRKLYCILDGILSRAITCKFIKDYRKRGERLHVFLRRIQAQSVQYFE